MTAGRRQVNVRFIAAIPVATGQNVTRMKRYSKALLIVVLTLVIWCRTSAGTYTASASGNWSSAATWTAVNNNKTGTITASTSSTTVTGTGTAFLTELSVGSVIGTQTNKAIGTVAAIISNTQLVLTANATNAATTLAYRTTDGPGGTVDDVVISQNVNLTIDVNAGATNMSTSSATSSAAGIITVNTGISFTLSGTFTITFNTSGTGYTTFNLNGSMQASSIFLYNVPTVTATLPTTNVTINTGTLTVTSNFIFYSLQGSSNTFNLAGTGTLRVTDGLGGGNLQVGSDSYFAPSANRTITLNSTITNLVAENVQLNGLWEGNTGNNFVSNPTVNLNSGTWDLVSMSVSDYNAINNSRFVLGNSSPVFKIADLFYPNSGTFTRTLNGTGATVHYDGLQNQTVYNTTYTNLVLSGSGTKTLAGTFSTGSLTVNQVTMANAGFAVTSNSTTLYTGGTAASVISGTATLTLGGDVIVTDAAAGSNGATISCPLALTNATTRTFTVADNTSVAADLTVSGLISTTGALTKAGAGTLVLSNASNSYSGTNTITAGTLSISSNANLGNTSSAITLNGGKLATTATISSARNISLTANSTIDVASGTTLTLSGIISGTPILTKTGSGDLTLSGTNTYQGGTTYTGGTLTITSESNIGTGSLTLSDGAVALPSAFNLTRTITLTSSTNNSIFVNSGTATISGTIQGAGNLLKTGLATLTLSGSNTYSGTTTVSAGWLNLTADASLGTAPVSATAGNINLTASGAGIIFANSFTLNANRGIAVSSGATLSPSTGVTTTYGGTITGAGLNKSGAGTLVLSGNNTFSGLTFNSGTINANSNAALGTGTVTFVNAVTLDNTSGGNITLSNTGYTLNGDLTFTGTNNLSFGTGGITLGGNRTINVNANTLTFAGAIGDGAGSYSISKSGAGTLALTGSNTYKGATTVSAGILSINRDAALGTAPSVATPASLVLNGGTLSFAAGFALSTTRGISLAAASVIDIASGASVIYSGVIAGSATFTKTGTGDLTLSGVNSYTGTTTVTTGRLYINSDNSLGATPGVITPGNIVLNGGTLSMFGSFTLSTNRGMTLQSNSFIEVAAADLTVNYGGAIAGSAGFNKTGLGKLVLTGNSSFTGSTSIDNGTLTISADANLGTAPASATANSLVLNGGTLNGSASFTINSNRGINVSAYSFIDVNAGATVSYGGAMTGAGLLAKSSAGALTLSGASPAFSGGINLMAGTLNINNSSAIGTGDLTISASSVLDNTSGSAVTISTNNLQYWNGDFTFTGSNPLNMGIGAVTMSANRIITVTGSTFTVGGNIASSSYTLTKAGNGALALSGNNLFSGGCTMNAGTLNINSAMALGTGIFTINAGILNNTSGSSVTLSTNNTQMWNTDIVFTGSNSLNLGTGNIYLNANRIVTVNGNTLVAGGVINGSTFSLTKQGTGALTLAGANTFSGGVTLSAGTLNINHASALGTGTFTIAGGTTIDNTSGGSIQTGNNTQVWNGNFTFSGTSPLNLGSGAIAMNASRQITVNGSTLTLAGVIGPGAFALTKQGPGALTLAGNNTFSAGVTLSAGTLNINSAAALGTGTFTVGDGTTIDNTSGSSVTLNSIPISLTGNFTFSGSNNLSLGAGTVTLTNLPQVTTNGAVLTIPGPIAGNGQVLYKAGSGELTLSGSNSFVTGGIQTIAGVLNLNNAAAIGSGNLRIDGGTIDNTSGSPITLTNGANSVFGNFTFRGTNNLTFSTGNFTLNNSPQITVSAATLALPGIVSGASSSLTKAGAGTLTLSGANTFALGCSLTAGTLNINHAQALGSGTFTINGGTIDNTSGGSISVTNAHQWNAGFTFAGSNPLNLGTSNVTLGANVIVTASNNTLTVGGKISGAFSLAKSGTGTLTLSANNSDFSGGFTLNTGTLNINGTSAVGTGTLTIAGGTINNSSAGAITLSTNNTQIWSADFTFTGTNALNLGTGTVTLTAARQLTVSASTLTVGGALNSTNRLTKTGAGTLTIAGNSAATFSGGITLSGGGLNINHAGALGTGSVIIGAGTTIDNTSGGSVVLTTNNQHTWQGDFVFTGTNSLDIGTGAVTMSGNTQVTTTANTLAIGGSISGTGLRLTKLGAGTLTLAGANTLTGGVTLSAGTLNINNADALGTAAATFIISGGTIDNTSGGSIRLNNNPQQWNADFTFTGSNALNMGTGAVTLSASRQVIVAANTLTVAGVVGDGGSGYSLTKAGSGALILSGSNTYSGITTLSLGTLSINADNNLGTAPGAATAGKLVLGGGTLATTAGFTLSSNRGISVTGATNLDVATGTTLVYGGIIAGTARITKTNTGILTLSGSSSAYTGGVTLSAGTLNINNAAALGGSSATFIISGGTIDNTSGSSVTLNNNPQQWNSDFTFTGSNALNTGAGPVTLNASRQVTVGANTLTVAGIIADGGSGYNLTKAGSGTLTLTGANTYSGTTTLSLGTLSISADNNLGTAPASVTAGKLVLAGGTLATTAGFTLNSNRGISVTGATNLDVATGTTLVYGGIIAGTAQLTKANNGTLTLSGASSGYSGGIVHNAGTLNINNAAALGTGLFTVQANTTIDNTSGADIKLSTTTPQTWNGNFTYAGSKSLNMYNGNISIAAPTQITVAGNSFSLEGTILGFRLTKAGSGMMTLAGTSTNFTGGVTLLTGSLNINNAAALGTATFIVNPNTTIDNTSGADITLSTTTAQTWNGSFNFTGSKSLNMGTGAVSVTNTSQINVAANTLAVGGSLSGTNRITKTGNGTITLAGASSGFSGGVTLSAGTININNAAALGSSAATFIIDGGTIDNTSGSSITLSTNNPQQWNGDFSFTGSNALHLGSGAVTLNALRTLNIAAGNLTVAGNIAGATFGLIKNGNGALTLAGASTFDGGFILNSGSLNLNSAGALGAGGLTIVGNTTIDNTSGSAVALTNTGGTSVQNDFTFAGTSPLSFNTGVIQVDANRIFTVNGTAALTMPGEVRGSVVITKNGTGTLTFSGPNTFTNGFVLNSGTVNINNNSALGIGSFTINGGTIDNTSGSLKTITNPQTWNADVAFTGTSSLTFSGTPITLSASRQVTVNNNVLTVAGAISASSYNLTKAGAGTLAFSNQSITFNNVAINAGGLTSTSGVLTIGGNFSNAGTFTHNSGTVTLNKSGTQTIGGATFNNLNITGSGTKTATGNIGVNALLNVISGTVLDMGNNDITGSTLTTSGTGMVTTTSVSATPLPDNRTWTMEVKYAAAAGQTMPPGTFAKITSAGTGTKQLTGTVTVDSLNLEAATISNGVQTLKITTAITRTTGVITASSGNIQFFNQANAITIPSGTFSGTVPSMYINGGKSAIMASNYGTLVVGNLTTSNSGSYLDINGQTLNITGSVSMSSGNGLIGSKASNLSIGTVGVSAVAIPAVYFDQSRPGNSNAVYNFTINNSGGGVFTLGDTLRIVNTFQPPPAGGFTFNTGSKLILESRSTGTARIATIPAGTLSFTGSVIAERYVSAKTDKRRYVFASTPVDGLTIRNAWQDDIFITAPGTGGTPCGSGTGNGGATDRYNNLGYDATQANVYTLFTYSQVNGWQGIGTNTTTTTLNKGIGYRVLYRGSRGVNNSNCVSLLTTQSPGLPDSTILSVTGTVTTGDVVANIYGPGSSTYGYTLLGNPYPCELSWSNFLADNPLLEDVYYTHDPNSTSQTGYLAYSAGTVTGAGGTNSGAITDANGNNIASGQAFLVRVKNTKVTGSGYQSTVTFKETHKTTTAQKGAFRSTGDSVLYRWKNMVRINFATSGDTYIDDVVIRYSSDSSITTAANGPLDVNTLNSGDFIATMKSTFSYAIQTRPISFTNDTVPVRVVSSVTGDFKLKFSEYEHFDSAAQILLLDAFTGTTTDIKQNPTYAFTISSDAASQGTNRFKLVFRTPTSVLPVSFLNVAAKAKDEGAVVSWRVAFEQKIQYYSIERSEDGKNFSRIGSVLSKGDSNTPVEYSYIDQRINGKAYYRVKSNEQSGAATYSAIVEVNGSRESLISVYPNPVAAKLTLVCAGTTNLRNARIHILDLQGHEVLSEILSASPGQYWVDVSLLAQGVYVFSIPKSDGTALTGRFIKQ